MTMDWLFANGSLLFLPQKLTANTVRYSYSLTCVYMHVYTGNTLKAYTATVKLMDLLSCKLLMPISVHPRI